MVRSSQSSSVGTILFFLWTLHVFLYCILFNSEMVGEKHCGFYATSGRRVVLFHGKAQKDGGWSNLVVITVYIYLERSAY